MVWYVPPLSPIVNSLETDGYEADPDDVFGVIEQLRIPVDYLANLLTAGDSEVIRGVLRRLAAMRGHMRKREVLGEHDDEMAAAVGMSVQDVEDMYRLLAIAKYEDRYVIPQAHTELGERLMQQQGTCGLDFEGGPGNCGMVGIVAPESQADAEGFMLTDQPTELDIIQMLGEQRQADEAEG
jgi:nitrate reductase beta subunit